VIVTFGIVTSSVASRGHISGEQDKADMRFKFHMEINKNIAFSNANPFTVVDVYRRFRRVYATYRVEGYVLRGRA
jgi:hypothetical protein